MYDIKPNFSERNSIWWILIILIAFIFAIIVGALRDMRVFLAVSFILSGGFFAIVINIKKEENLKKYNYKRLQEHGVLVKGVKCKCNETVEGNYRKYVLVVEFKTPMGKKISLERKLEHNERWNDLKELDLLLDPEDYSNYRLEPQINRIK